MSPDVVVRSDGGPPSGLRTELRRDAREDLGALLVVEGEGQRDHDLVDLAERAVRVPPGGLDAFADTVIPLLQERGGFREDYEGATLWDRLGLAELWQDRRSELKESLQGAGSLSSVPAQAYFMFLEGDMDDAVMSPSSTGPSTWTRPTCAPSRGRLRRGRAPELASTSYRISRTGSR